MKIPIPVIHIKLPDWYVLHLALTVCVWTIIYLFKTWVIWEFTNPFNWIIAIPTYDQGDRAGILIGVLMYQGIQMTVAYNVMKKDVKEDYDPDRCKYKKEYGRDAISICKWPNCACQAKGVSYE